MKGIGVWWIFAILGAAVIDMLSEIADSLWYKWLG
jgi:hypothetical protein